LGHSAFASSNDDRDAFYSTRGEEFDDGGIAMPARLREGGGLGDEAPSGADAADDSPGPATVDSDGVEDVFSYARHNRIDELNGVLDRGVPVNVKDKFGNTLLCIACQNGWKRIAKAVLRRGADINAQNHKGNTPLHFAFSYGYGDSLGQYLISKGADPAIRNQEGFTCYDGIGGCNVAT
jgi:ankyrin repeat protein